MTDATHLKAHRTAASLLRRGALYRHLGRTKGCPTSKLHALSRRPGVPLLSASQMSDHRGARFVLDALPPAAALSVDRGYDSCRLREALMAKGITSRVPSSKVRRGPRPPPGRSRPPRAAAPASSDGRHPGASPTSGPHRSRRAAPIAALEPHGRGFPHAFAKRLGHP